MKPSFFGLMACLTVLIAPTTSLAQGSEDIRLADIAALRELGKPAPQGMRAAMLIKSKVRRNSEIAVWEVYANARQSWAIANQLAMPDVEGPISPKFEEEVSARRALADALKESGRRVGKSHRNYSADLQKVIEAEFFEEYVFETYREPDWELGERDLRIDEFKTWAAENIPEHESLSYAFRVARAANRTRAVFIVIDSELENASEGAFWLKYALERFTYRKDNQLPFDLLIGEEAIPTYKEELAARRALLKDFDDIQDSLSDATRTAIKQMVAVEAEGFLREYVWEYLHQEGWEEPAELKLQEFKNWAEKEITGHKAPTHSILMGR